MQILIIYIYILFFFFLILLAICSKEVLRSTSLSHRSCLGRVQVLPSWRQRAPVWFHQGFQLAFGNHVLAYFKKETIPEQEHCLHGPNNNRRWMLSLGVPRPLPTGIFARPAPRARAADVPATTQGETS